MQDDLRIEVEEDAALDLGVGAVEPAAGGEGVALAQHVRLGCGGEVVADCWAVAASTSCLSVLGLLRDVPFWLSMAGGLALQALALYWPPLASTLLTGPLSGADIARVLGMSLFALAVVETGKLLTAPTEAS